MANSASIAPDESGADLSAGGGSPGGTGSSEPTGGFDRRQIVYGACGLIALTVLVYLPVLEKMIHHWSVVEDYGHGFLIAPLALWFAYERRWDLEDAPIKGDWLGVAPMLIGLAAMFVGRLSGELMTIRSGFVFTLIGLVLLILGREIFKILSFPLFFLFLMVPLPQALVNTIAFPLQLIAAQAAVSSLQEIGIPALVEGNIIHLAHAELFVADACSGLRSLMALVTLGVVFAHFFKRGHLFLQLLLVASTIPIAIAVNSFRVALTGFLAHYFGQDVATGAIHDFQGVFTFGMAFFLLLGQARLMDWIADLRARNNSGEPGQGNTPPESPVTP